MDPTTPTNEQEAREFSKNKFSAGSWRFLVFLTVYFCSAISGLYIGKFFGAPAGSPGSDPPWYFIRQDFFQGVGSLAGIVLMLALLAVTWRRYPFTNWMMLMMVGIWMVPSVVTAAIIYVQCANFFDYPSAVSAWPTFDAYLKSGVKFVGMAIVFVLVAAIVGPIAWRKYRKKRDLS